MYVLIEFVISVIAVLVSVVIIFAHERMLYLDATPPYWVCKLFSDDCKMSLEEVSIYYKTNSYFNIFFNDVQLKCRTLR